MSWFYRYIPVRNVWTDTTTMEFACIEEIVTPLWVWNVNVGVCDEGRNENKESNTSPERSKNSEQE